MIYAKYQLISIIGAIFFLIFIIFTISSYIFMYSRYKNVRTLIGEKTKMEDSKIKIEEILFKIISYISLIVVFFHQYIIEYYSLVYMDLFIIKLVCLLKMEIFQVFT